MHMLRRSVVIALALFAVIALLWAAIGYRYGDGHRMASAVEFGGIALAVGWALVAIAVGVKYSKLLARRRRIDAASPSPGSATDQ